MKEVLKKALVLVSVLLVFAFTGCENTSNKSNKSTGEETVDNTEDTVENKEVTVVAVYFSLNKLYYIGRIERTLTFYSDYTYIEHFKSDDLDYDSTKGTYTGDPSKDGTINIAETHGFTNDKWYKWPSSKKYEITISDGSFEFEDEVYTKQ
jgi:hypothetical protein